jgi:hypothetical protein
MLLLAKTAALDFFLASTLMEWKILYILAATVAIPLSSMVVAANILRVRKNMIESWTT